METELRVVALEEITHRRIITVKVDHKAKNCQTKTNSRNAIQLGRNTPHNKLKTRSTNFRRLLISSSLAVDNITRRTSDANFGAKLDFEMVGFLGALHFPLFLHFAAAASSPHSTLIGAEGFTVITVQNCSTTINDANYVAAVSPARRKVERGENGAAVKCRNFGKRRIPVKTRRTAASCALLWRLILAGAVRWQETEQLDKIIGTAVSTKSRHLTEEIYFANEVIRDGARFSEKQKRGIKVFPANASRCRFVITAVYPIRDYDLSPTPNGRLRILTFVDVARGLYSSFRHGAVFGIFGVMNFVVLNYSGVSVCAYAPIPNDIMQQVNTRSHSARTTQNALRCADTITWHAKSSDLSPIEHIRIRWGDICTTANHLPKHLFPSIRIVLPLEKNTWAVYPKTHEATLAGIPNTTEHCRFGLEQRYDGNTSRIARRSDEALEVRVSAARIAPSLLDLGLNLHAIIIVCAVTFITVTSHEVPTSPGAFATTCKSCVLLCDSLYVGKVCLSYDRERIRYSCEGDRYVPPSLGENIPSEQDSLRPISLRQFTLSLYSSYLLYEREYGVFVFTKGKPHLRNTGMENHMWKTSPSTVGRDQTHDFATATLTYHRATKDLRPPYDVTGGQRINTSSTVLILQQDFCYTARRHEN
ncbi:hypothetical protein PR048_019763 [Dryococelus australis]|uniref:Uncharacterized protein n=1 Tax=Dryococelus australis TaxID=614101 RepID=A0ABQ9H4F3_9NEOP|nr:hypothetical protein PR048_019763 [Dryococelus australis]